jgi:putative sugar O-methyltransferase
MNQKKGSRPTQLKDDLSLLDLMTEDTESASDLYKPTNYWANYGKKLLPQLRSLGLRDFRRNKRMSILSRFGATDLLPISEARISLWKSISIPPKVLELLSEVKTFEKLFGAISRGVSGVELQDVRTLCYEFAECYGEANGAKSIRELEASTVGNPENLFLVQGKMYTMLLLYYYIQYAYCCKYLDFDSIDTMVEIGSGAGKQIEVIKKLHPHISVYVFDIPPQLYVCEEYLSALFPDSVVSYRETRTMTSIPSDHEGKVFIFGNWKLPELSNFKYDLFWNSASFQEMEPDVVLNYLKCVNEQTNYVFLNEMMGGQKLANRKGQLGVLEQTKLEHYKRGLKDFELLDLSKSIFLPRSDLRYSFSFWTKKR